ncbi:tetratricopeptide repeat protein [Starkeya sp. ORNL1]|uniref:tetratricopeptide repeat protein n=1 Tax=Starkeya sp. ORNL1 TaxID=2709380 RepID=UPI001FED62A2|nr:tetratricopeptide repeat protein [Starkeya sp. ORNL1]
MNARKHHSSRAVAMLVAMLVAALGIAAWLVGWSALWASPDQRGRYLFEHGKYQQAADAFLDPMWRGAALMRAGNFKDAAQTFAGIDTADGAYDHGNALVMLGKYDDAVARYDRALGLRPGFADAEANRTLAQLRAERMKAPGGEAGDQREGADQIVYDKDAKNPGGQQTDTAGAPMSDEAVRALWLKRVQTRPADFLRARFGYQLQQQGGTSP